MAGLLDVDFSDPTFLMFDQLPSLGSPLSSPFLSTEDVFLSGSSSSPELVSDYSIPSDSSPHSDPFSYVEDIKLDSSQMNVPQTYSNWELPTISVCDGVMEKPIETTIAVEPEKKKRGRKRTKVDDGDPDASRVTLTPYQILHLTTQEVDDMTKKWSIERPLSIAEQKKMKDQRRRVSNRESAQQSRDKKKNYVQELEAHVRELQDQNQRLTMENNSLREEVYRLYNQYKPNGVSLDAPLRLSQETFNKTKNAGICLLIVMFSFALFMNIQSTPSIPIPQRIQRMTPMIPQRTEPMMHGRRLMELNPENSQRSIKQLHQTIDPNIGNPPIIQSQPKTPTRVELYRGPNKKVEHSLRFKKMKIEPAVMEVDTEPLVGTEIPRVHFVEFMNESGGHSNSTRPQLELQLEPAVEQWFKEKQRENPNTAFFTTSSLSQIMTPDMPKLNPDEPLFISLLIPISTNSENLENSENPENSVVEILCRVMSVNETSFIYEERMTPDNRILS
eukprot:TRINITY_DN15032_c0_g1_i1.p1 TRINITY_DN15032_c0_g1~~TRINITY_DN15032_c0_g1_i1.p1  ORF type:complete len:503 (-),score=150.13 TRINITY_DN15032_c0_g1_i1:218-1726(-)